MKVLLLNGSPHKDGCTYTALCAVAAGLAEEGVEYEILHVGTPSVSGCMGCGACRNSGKCVYTNDAVNSVAQKVEEYDGFVFGTPVHYASASGAITSFLDRLFYICSSKMAFKPGAAIASARRAGTSAALDQINKYFSIANMPIVSSQYWNMVHGSKSEDVAKDEEGMQTMRVLGRNMAWLIKSIEAGKKAGIERPQKEERAWTNFIR